MDKTKQTVDDSSGRGGDPDTLSELDIQDSQERNTSQGNNNTPEPPIDKNLNNSREADKKDCSFKRGICTIDGIKGNKKTISRKVWIKKKSGLYGWSTTRVVNYECVHNEKAETV